jgi:hypothetical protein
MYNVYTIVPTYCDRDGINGHRAIRHPYVFHTELGAKAVAVLLANDGDDMAYHVAVPVGASPFDHKAAMRLYRSLPTRALQEAADPMDDCPF